MMNKSSLLTAQNVNAAFGSHQVLKGVNLSVDAHEVLALIGPSGCGKSTFLRCLNLLDHPSSGSIHVDGCNILDKKADIAKVRQKMNMVFQSFNLFVCWFGLFNPDLAIGLDAGPQRRTFVGFL